MAANNTTIIRFPRCREIQASRQNALLHLTEDIVHIVGQPVIVSYYTDLSKTSVDTMVAMGIKNGKGRDCFSIVHTGQFIVVNDVIYNIPDITSLVHEEIYLLNKADGDGLWYLAYSEDGVHKTIQRIDSKPKFYFNLQDNSIWVSGSDRVARPLYDIYTKTEVDAIIEQIKIETDVEKIEELEGRITDDELATAQALNMLNDLARQHEQLLAEHADLLEKHAKLLAKHTELLAEKTTRVYETEVTDEEAKSIRIEGTTHNCGAHPFVTVFHGDSVAYADVTIDDEDVIVSWEITPSNEAPVVIKIFGNSIDEPTEPAANEIWYTSENGQIVTPYNLEALPTIVMNTYERGKGVISFMGDVTYIGDEAFQNCSTLTSVTLPDGLAEIGDYAFNGCSGLTSFKIPSSVTNIGYNAFNHNDSLTAVYIEDLSAWCSIPFHSSQSNPLSYAGNLYLDKEPVTNLVIPEDVTNVESYTFYNCKSLESITIPSTVEQIKEYAFWGCSNVDSLTISEGVEIIGNNAFESCADLTSIVIPNSVTEIRQRAFYNCNDIASVTIGNGIESIGGYCFRSSDSIETVTCNATVPPTIQSTTWGESSKASTIFYVPEDYVSDYQAAQNWSDIANIRPIPVIIPAREIWYTSTDGNIVNPNASYLPEILANTYIDGKGLLQFAEDVTSIGLNSFKQCQTLRTVEMSGSVTEIGDYAFSGCTNLVKVRLSDHASIGGHAFENCSSLGNIIIPEGVTSLGARSFAGCSLTTVSIPSSVTSISNDAFYGCSSLIGITVAAGNSKYDSRSNCNAVIETASNTLVLGCQNSTVPSNVQLIGNGAFLHCTNLTNITIPRSVKGIGELAFSETGLLAISLPSNGVLSISRGAFQDNATLATVELPNSLLSIEGDAFRNCTALTAITIPETVNSINGSAFNGCNNLANISVNSNNTTYDSREECKAIIQTSTNKLVVGCKNTTIPNTVTAIDEFAFCDCASLTTISIPEGVTRIENSAFSGCTGLTVIALPSGMAVINDNAFYGCTGITNIILPSSITNIGSSAFQGCSSVSTITCRAIEPPTIKSANAWQGVDKTIPLRVPNSAVSRYKNAQYWSDFENVISL